jgi:hypothetical protein
VDDDLDAARALLPGTTLTAVADLGGSGRSAVRRVTAGADTLVVKAYKQSGGWVREAAALAVLTALPSAVPAPRLVADGPAPPVVVMSDLGGGPSVADALLGTDPVAAADAVGSWAVAVAAVHRATAGSRADFEAALAERAGDFPVAPSTMVDDVDNGAKLLARHAADFGITASGAALEELRALAGALETGPASLTPNDACPDNNLRTAGGLVLLDYEHAQWRHLAWDVAYLAVPWPTCWCSWLLPDEVSARATDAYVAALGLPWAGSAAFGRDVATATVCWSVLTAGWMLGTALGADPPSAVPGRAMPSRRPLVLHRLAAVSRATGVPALAGFAGELRAALADRWGELELGYAPAFR